MNKRRWDEKERKAMAAVCRRAEAALGSREVGCQAARTVRRSTTRGTAALDDLGVHLAGAAEVYARPCRHLAAEVVTMANGAKAWACRIHARQDARGRRIRWLERSACLSEPAEWETAQEFRSGFARAQATLPPELLAAHNARELEKGNRAVRAWADRQRTASGEWPLPDDERQLTFDPGARAMARAHR